MVIRQDNEGGHIRRGGADKEIKLLGGEVVPLLAPHRTYLSAGAAG